MQYGMHKTNDCVCRPVHTLDRTSCRVLFPSCEEKIAAIVQWQRFCVSEAARSMFDRYGLPTGMEECNDDLK